MKTWQVFAVVGAIVAVGWLLFRRGGGGTIVPGTGLTGFSMDGPPSSATSPSQAPVANTSSVDALWAAQLAQWEAANGGLTPSKGPAHENIRGPGHF